MRRIVVACVFWVLVGLTGCDGIATGEKVDSMPVVQNKEGGYGPFALLLTPEMSPVAINFRAEHGIDPSLAGKWNTYRASLKRQGTEVAGSKFTVNYAGNADGQPGSPYTLKNMLTARISELGEYELTITPEAPPAVPLASVVLEVRKNVAGNANLR